MDTTELSNFDTNVQFLKIHSEIVVMELWTVWSQKIRAIVEEGLACNRSLSVKVLVGFFQQR